LGVFHWLNKGTLNNVDDDLYEIEQKIKDPTVHRYAKRTLKKMDKEAREKDMFAKSQQRHRQNKSSKLEKLDYLAMIIAGIQVIGPVLLVIGVVYFIIFFILKAMF